MILRKLEIKDASLMLEWMHDKSVTQHLATNFGEKTIEDCENFIKMSQDDKCNLNLAISNDAGEYMGTVSLKHINKEKKIAEFAIATRSIAMGKGFACVAMQQILDVGLCELGLDKIYWCVSPINKRAVKFYDKNGYQRVLPTEFEPIGYTSEEITGYYWYLVKRQ